MKLNRRSKRKNRKNRFFILQTFIIGVVLVVVSGLTRGIIYEDELARAQYPPGISVIGIAKQGYYDSRQPLPLEYIAAVDERGGMVTEYWEDLERRPRLPWYDSSLLGNIPA